MTKCGYIAIIGRPNVGKSTLLNQLLQRKLSITSRKPQTTRHQLLGIKTKDSVQYLYVDTPGIHLKADKALNRFMNRTALKVLRQVDVILFLVEALNWKRDDAWILSKLKNTSAPIILLVNKVDRYKGYPHLLPFIEKIASLHPFRHVILISAKTAYNVDALEALLAELLPEGVHLFPAEQITDRSDNYLIAEIIREKLIRNTGQELPYSVTVEVENLQKQANLWRINAVIWVEKEGQKKIIIGTGGNKLKEIGQQARIDMERLFNKKVFLQLWIKVKSGWSNNIRALKSLGFQHDANQ